MSLDAVAKKAGVGVGTLYRHFPTREALVEAAYLTELDRLYDGAGELLAEHPPDEALARVDGPVRGVRADQARAGGGAAGGHRLRWRSLPPVADQDHGGA